MLELKKLLVDEAMTTDKSEQTLEIEGKVCSNDAVQIDVN